MKVLTPVGVKKAYQMSIADRLCHVTRILRTGMPAPPHLSFSAKVPCGVSSMAISPLRYFFSRALLLPKKLQIALLTWPPVMSGESPPPIAVPALFDTAVSECRLSGPRFAKAPMMVSAVPHNPKPALRMVDPDLLSATASSTESKTFRCPRTFVGAPPGASRKNAVLVRNDRVWLVCCFSLHPARDVWVTRICTAGAPASFGTKEQANSMMLRQPSAPDRLANAMDVERMETVETSWSLQTT